jgi:hypothetical protein
VEIPAHGIVEDSRRGTVATPTTAIARFDRDR